MILSHFLPLLSSVFCYFFLTKIYNYNYFDDVYSYFINCYLSNTYAKIPPLASFHAGCDGNHSVESPEACHRIRTRRRGILIRKFHDRGHGMTWKGEATPHPLSTLCTIRSRKITIAVSVAPKHTGDLKLLPPKLHNELKLPIDRTILALGRINALPPNQSVAQIGVGIVCQVHFLFFFTINLQ